MADLTQLKRKRGQIKSSLTRQNHYYEALNLEQINNETYNQLKLRLNKISPLLESFNEVQSDIELGDVNDDSEYSERAEFENTYYALCANIESIIQKFTPNLSNSKIFEVDNVSQTITDEPNENVHVPNATIDQVSNINPLQVQLPIMQLPTFNGDYNNWVEFRDSFKALIDDNKLLSDVQRMHHLRSCLSKEVLQTIQAFPISASNYKIAWEALRERYEKSQLIVRTHVRSILDFPKLTKESPKDLRNLYNNINNNLQALKALGEAVEYWDTLLIPIITDKLDNTSRRDWEYLCTKETTKVATDTTRVVTLKDLFNLIKSRCELLEKLDFNKPQGFKYGKSITNVSTSKISCFFCKKNHTIYKCQDFLSFTPTVRYNEVQKLKLCVNCLKQNHTAAQCQASKCRKCGKAHNSLLHLGKTSFNNSHQLNLVGNEISETDRTQDVANSDNMDTSCSSNAQVSTNHTVKAIDNIISNVSTSQVLLSTAIVLIEDMNGTLHKCRALLDNGSMSNFITKRLCEKLNMNITQVDYAITGVGQAMSNVKFATSFNLQSRNGLFKTRISCLVLSEVTANLPISSFNKNMLDIPTGLELADPRYNETSSIDLLLGSSIFWKVLHPEQKQVLSRDMFLQNTKFGWIVTGTLNLPQYNTKSINCLSTSRVDERLSKFWEIEEVNTTPIFSKSEQYCEEHFRNSIKRNSDGRFVVKIPFKQNCECLGQSRNLALNRFYLQEQRLVKDQELYNKYKKFMREYESMDHMTEIKETHNSEELNYYMPHHAVVKKSSTTTQVRVVFDASMKTDTGISLNDAQHVGPSIQTDLFSILLSFRMHEYVISADISKMYRMILIDPEQRRFQRIFWRDDPKGPVKCYELKTVTYGTASAPFLAIRCLHELANENAAEYPAASEAIKNNFYVDDFLFGADSKFELVKIQHEVNQILCSSGLELRKWLCNKPEWCTDFQINKNLDSSIIQLGEHEANKTLGICWNATDDVIQYAVKEFPEEGRLTTKRVILSEISQIFDPLGLLAPIIISCKLLIQALWQAKISWDEQVPEDLSRIWYKFREDLKNIVTIKVPRFIVLPQYEALELHGFADASEKAYGACIYIRSKQNGRYNSQLLCAKGKVAPIKQVTLPRLELCSAVLLAQLVHKVHTAIKIPVDKQYLWSDSTITLSWIRACPKRWKTFVANRVSEIQRLTNIEDWYHVASNENPADIVSRGIAVEDLQDSKLWWSGPYWLSEDSLQLASIDDFIEDKVPEERISTNTVLNVNCDIFARYSILTTLQRVVAYCVRFANNCKVNVESRLTGPLTVTELEYSLNALCRLAQQVSFSREYNDLLKARAIHNKSNILSLNPYLDDGLIRVGGRLQNSTCSFNKKHPIIISSKHKLTQLIFEEEHKRLGHCGPTMLLSSIRERYWPVAGRSLAKLTVRNCITCFRTRPRSLHYLMGNLPEPRVNQYLPFFNTGVDYAGPVTLKDRTTRKPRLIKGYICIFVCLASKAVHLEAVSDLTTQCFLATLNRFISRRGKPRNIYSDNAKNFVGANAELKKLQMFLQSENLNISNFLAKDRISWHFIPARAPNFGGIWEAGVKSIKYHLHRVVGNAHLTFEQFTTVLTQIEAILNSRPLCPLTADPDTLDPLTPGHFLIGKSLTSLPEPDYTSIPENRLKQYQRLQQITQHFWLRWHKEYLSELQKRVKWQKDTENPISVGSLVLIKEDNTPPTQWHLGRITELHPGSDGVVRVASIKVNDGVIKRSVSKICPLPNVHLNNKM